MAHLSLSPPVGAGQFTPLSESYARTTKDGDVPVINFLLGSQYNIKIDGEINITSTGNISNDTLKAVTGKLEIAGQSDGTEIKKIGSFSSFMYFFPGVKILGHSELQDPTVASGTERIRYEYEDLATGDMLRVDLTSGASNANLKLLEVVSGVETELASFTLTGSVEEIQWELDFLDGGVTKFYYKEASGVKTRIFNGDVNANIAECKVSCQLISNQTSVKTVKSDYLFILYPNVFIGYDAPLVERLSGRVRVWDDMNEVSEADWFEVFSGDHKFIGLRIIENGMIRIKFKTTPSMEVFGWNTVSVAWQSIGDISPMSSAGDLATTLHNIVFEKFNNVHVKVIAKYGIVDHVIDIKRGWPCARIASNGKNIRVDTTKRRFALSVDNTSTEILNFNQKTSDDANRGNPLNLTVPDNPYIFVTGTDIDKGINRIDDNWYAWYNENSSNDMVGWLGVLKKPTALKISANSATELDYIQWGFDTDPTIFSIGILRGDSTALINGVPTPFHIGNIDQYIKWRANESIFGFDQKQLPRTKR